MGNAVREHCRHEGVDQQPAERLVLQVSRHLLKSRLSTILSGPRLISRAQNRSPGIGKGQVQEPILVAAFRRDCRMAEMMTTDVRALLDRKPFDDSAVADLREVLGRDPSRYRTLRDAVAAMRDREKGAMTPEIHLRSRRGRGAARPLPVGTRAPEQGRRRRPGALPPRARATRTSSGGTRPPTPSPPPPRRATIPRSPSFTAPARCVGRARSTRRRRSSAI